MPLFGALYVGTSGLQTSQEALNVVAHNVTNADTEGYVRQQVSQGTREYNRLSIDYKGVAEMQVGLGVYIEEVRQFRDQFVDKSYRDEYGRQGFYDASFGAIEEVEEILGELDGATFYESMTDIWSAIEELVKDPSSEVCQSMFVQYAQSFCEASNNVYNDFCNYQDKLNFQIKTYVDRINEIGNNIYELNNKIRAIESGGVEHANDLRDDRNLLIDELAKIANISYEVDHFGNVLVSLEGHNFVQMDRCNKMGCQADENDFYSCFWPDTAKFSYDNYGNKVFRPETAPVFNFNVEISSTINTDIGALKGVVLARGDHRGTYADLMNPVTEDPDVEAYNKVKESIMMNIMAEFDGLVHNVVTAINGVIADNCDPSTGYLCYSGTTEPMQLFERVGAKPDTPVDAKDPKSWFNAANITVNMDLLQYPTHLSMLKPDGSVDYKTAKNFEDAFNAKIYILNPTLTNPVSLSEYYSNLVAQVSNSGNVYKSLKENQDLTVLSIEGTRQGNFGVSTDEELSNMIKYQNAYNASSRYINVIDECLEHLINTLGA